MNMTFAYAWYNLMHGHEIRRKDWPNGERLKLVEDQINVLYADGSFGLWQPMQYDMIASNWEIHGTY